MLEQNLSERIKQFKKIDAHSHVGYFGSWCDVGITPEELIAQMDEYNVEKSVICTYPIQDSLDAVDKYPDRLVGAAWLNPMRSRLSGHLKRRREKPQLQSSQAPPAGTGLLPE